MKIPREQGAAFHQLAQTMQSHGHDLLAGVWGPEKRHPSISDEMLRLGETIQ
jgi:hypothetical protein